MDAVISVCICTHNRSQSLRRTLESLADQHDLNEGGLEVLIIDNNCTDDTSQVVEAFQTALPIRLVTESHQGLARARNRAVKEFEGDVLLFTDDDIRFGTGWVSAYRDAFRRFPDAVYFGGRILPDWGDAKPGWIADAPLPLIDGALGWFDHGVQTRLTQTDEPPPFGASFAIRRGLFEELGAFELTWEPEEGGLDEARKLSFFCAQWPLERRAPMSAKRFVITPSTATGSRSWRYGVTALLVAGRTMRSRSDRIAVAMPRQRGSSSKEVLKS